MELKFRTDDDIDILKIEGRFDIYEALTLKKWLDTNNNNAKQVVVNLEGVNFVDSAGLASLVQILKHCRQQNGDLHVCLLQPSVKIIFELTRLDKAFKIFDSEDKAISAFSD